jgi:hypothetical protein
MNYESAQYEADFWQGVVVITDKTTRRCGAIAFHGKSAARMLASDAKKYGAEKALPVWAKLVENWQ